MTIHKTEETYFLSLIKPHRASLQCVCQLPRGKASRHKAGTDPQDTTAENIDIREKEVK